ncbi:hypothetical protein Taro_028613 [Colocasia esculenta]|uniref:Uncharacterized protein n=1 Tax=Colocasia esculenta TaxID=4460 RepID=A0A843VGW4_COLES|nr:hypothetical protein [Colocasia esculenta]
MFIEILISIPAIFVKMTRFITIKANESIFYLVLTLACMDLLKSPFHVRRLTMRRRRYLLMALGMIIFLLLFLFLNKNFHKFFIRDIKVLVHISFNRKSELEYTNESGVDLPDLLDLFELLCFEEDEECSDLVECAVRAEVF